MLRCVQFFATPWTVACQSPLSIGILRARTPEWAAMPSSRGSSQPRIKPRSSTLQADSLLSEPPGKPMCICESQSEVAQSCLTLCDLMDCSLPGSSVHGIFQARIVGCHFPLLGIFPTQGLNPSLPHRRQTLYRLSHQGSLNTSQLTYTQ